jgi:hypothetical protein
MDSSSIAQAPHEPTACQIYFAELLSLLAVQNLVGATRIIDASTVRTWG